jgi:hypothetical protein
MTINSAGDVGIGTDSPQVRLTLRRESNGSLFEFNRPASGVEALYGGIVGNDPYFYSNNGIFTLGINNPDGGLGGEVPYITMRNGATRYTTFEAGNVGIGTTNPGSKLEIEGLGVANTPLTLIKAFNTIPYSTGNGQGAATIEIGHSQMHGYIEAGSISEANSAAGYMAFGHRLQTNIKNEAMRINPSGNVGIGTTNPGSKLELYEVSGAAPTLLTLHQNAVDIVADDTMGSFIDFKSTDINNNFTPQARIGMLIRDSGGDSGVDSEGCGNLVFHTSRGTNSTGSGVDVERMRITDIGNVGIGTSTPNAKLDVQGTQGQLFSVTDDLSGDIFSVADISGVPIMNVNSDGTSYFDGNVGIGATSPTRKLSIEGTAYLRDNLAITVTDPGTNLSKDSEIYLQSKGNQSGTVRSSQWHLRTESDSVWGNSGFSISKGYDGGSAAEYVRITSGGNVGINVTNPTDARLKVLGNVIFDGYNTSDPDSTSRTAYPADQMFTHYANNGVSIIGGKGSYTGVGLTIGEETTRSSNFKFIRGVSDTNGGANAAEEFWVNGIGDAYFAGKVGIGTGSPATYLQIGAYPNSNINITTYPDIPSEHMIHLTAPETTGRYGGGISFGENTFTAANITAQDAGGNGSLHMLFGTRHTSGIVEERMRITSDGNVGINVTNPAYLLDVRDGTLSGAIAKFSAVNAHVIIESSTAGPAVLHLKPNTTGNKSGQFKVTTGEGYNFRWSNDAASTAEVTYMKLDTSTTGGGDLTVKGDIIAYGAPSDERYKENIKPIESALDKALKLQGVTFDWKESDSILDIKEDIGFIAQDVQKVIPELVRENEDGKLSLRYQGVTPILLEAIKELKAEIEELKKQIK